MDWFPLRNSLKHVKSEFFPCESLKICVKLWTIQDLFYSWSIWKIILPSLLFGTLRMLLVTYMTGFIRIHVKFLCKYIEFIDSVELYASYVIMWTKWTSETYFMFKSWTLWEILVNHCDSKLMNIKLYTNTESKWTMCLWHNWFMKMWCLQLLYTL